MPTTYANFLHFLDEIKRIKGEKSGYLFVRNKQDSDNIKNEVLKRVLLRFDNNKLKIGRMLENIHCNICENDLDGVCGKCHNCERFKQAPEDNIIDTNKWVDYFLSIYKNIQGNNWVDIEFEIEKVIKVIDKMEYDDGVTSGRKLLFEGISIKEMMNEKDVYKTNLDTKNKYVSILESDLNRFIKCFEQYLLIINKIPIQQYSPDITRMEIDKVLSFNYTNTYKRQYGKNSEIEYDYIHGQAGKDNVVLGFDEYLEGKDKNTNLLCIRFKKFFQRIYKGTGCEYKKWLSDGDNYNVHIFGHSLDVTDKDILSDIVMRKNVQTTVYYHDEEAHARQITNLVKIIGRDELIEKTYSANPQIEFKQQQPMGDL